MYLLDVHNAHEMGENLEKHGSSPQLPFKPAQSLNYNSDKS